MRVFKYSRRYSCVLVIYDPLSVHFIMSTGCDHVTHRAIEGILTYLNAFLLLDFARSSFKERQGTGVVVMIVITILIFYLLRKVCPHCDKTTPAVERPARIPPNPEELARINDRQWR